MAKRRSKNKFDTVEMRDIPERTEPYDEFELAMRVPAIISKADDSIIKAHQDKPDWSLYRTEKRKGNPFIVREMCDRCGRVKVLPGWLKIRAMEVEGIGTVYIETGLCKDCINASLYYDTYLDGEPITFTEANKQFYDYATEYERNWRIVLAAAPKTIITEAEWDKACEFFNGCAFCGGPIEVRGKYFPTALNGTHSAWNVLPLCQDCYKSHMMGRTKQVQRISKTGALQKTEIKPIRRYRVFSTVQAFNKQKTARLYLLKQMQIHGIYMDPLLDFMKRFRETKTLEGSE